MKLFHAAIWRGALVACAFSVLLCVGCAPASPADLPATGDAEGELAPLTEDIYYQGSAEPANEPYSEGKAPQGDTSQPQTADELLASCSQSCHKVAELQAWSASADEVQQEMEEMAALMSPALTQEQIDILVEYYAGK